MIVGLNISNQINIKFFYEARNDVLKKCNGKYISFLDTDDYWFENKLFLQVPILEKTIILD